MVWIVFGVFVHAGVVWMLWHEARSGSEQRTREPALTRTGDRGKNSFTFPRPRR